MTWEWVILILGLSVCVIAQSEFVSKSRSVSQSAAAIKNILDCLSQIEKRLCVVEEESAVISQLAESTKKLLSEANLVKGLKPQR